MKKQLIFAGGGHAHIHSLSNLDKFIKAGADVTVVNRSEYHYYSGMGPGFLSGFYTVDDIRFNIREIAESQGCRFVEAEIVKIIPDRRRILLSDGTEMQYDAISFNTGSEILSLPVTGDTKNIYPVKPVENIGRVKERVRAGTEKIRITVIGGGAAGVEIASNLNELIHKNQIEAEISIISRERLLPLFNKPFYNKTVNSLKRRKILIYEYKNADRISSDTIFLNSGEELKYDIAVNASGIKPSGLFTASGMKTGPDGGLMVNEYLQYVEYPEIFAGGDCISFNPSLDKVGVYAVREGMVLFGNLLAYVNGDELEEFKPQKSYLSILNMGFNKGIMLWKGIVLSGTVPFYFKYYLDSRFMKKYRKIRGDMR